MISTHVKYLCKKGYPNDNQRERNIKRGLESKGVGQQKKPQGKQSQGDDDGEDSTDA